MAQTAANSSDSIKSANSYLYRSTGRYVVYIIYIFTANVVACTAAELKTSINGKKTTIKGFEVILDDTILFPEGGGQPCDHGMLNGIPVHQVVRRGDEAVHFVEKPLTVGQSVHQRLDWDRRFDHMQQHSGQHLITALADSEFGYETTSWWLGDETSYIELDTPMITDMEIEKLEQIVNEKIRLSLVVTVNVHVESDPLLNVSHVTGQQVRTRGLPDDHKGPVRVVTIEGIESNMCCGTHVTNLSQLQVVKLVTAEKGKKGKTNLVFLVGGRVLKQFALMYKREMALTKSLNNGPTSHVDLVGKLQKSVKINKKNMQAVLKDLALLEAKALKDVKPKPKYYAIHRTEGDSDFMTIFANEVKDEGILLFLTTGDEKGAGNMALYGDPLVVGELGSQICKLLEGKGSIQGNKFQAKVSNLSNRDAAHSVIRLHLQND